MECPIHIIAMIRGGCRVDFRCRGDFSYFRRRAYDRMPSSMLGNRSDFPSRIFAIVGDGTRIIMADEWKGGYDGCYRGFCVEGDVVCTLR